mmetsp:Transcript_34532/g.72667  ORF Transcript_34532/g.72667 Transcript_34532/m.72667 type:complete len:241 (-) Transcript_34532:332-1054(-)
MYLTGQIALMLTSRPLFLPRADVICSENEAYTFVKQLRNAKAALRRGATQERGVLDADGLALVQGLGNVNPSAPNPTADTEFWTGSFELVSAPCANILASHGLRQARCTASVDCDRAVFEAELESSDERATGETGSNISIDCTIVAANDDAFVFGIRSVSVAGGLVQATQSCLKQMAPSAHVSEHADGWEALGLEDKPLAQLSASVVYLDQDLLILQLLPADALDASESLSDGLLIMYRT